jgi:hypothetical protein
MPTIEETEETNQYVLVIELPDEVLDGVEDIDNAASVVTEALNRVFGYQSCTARPLSEILSC